MQPTADGRDASTHAVLDALIQLRHQTAELTSRLSAADDPQARHRGKDPTGLVRVTVDGEGTVVDVDLDASWRKQIDPRALAGAVLAAYSAAGVQRFAAWTEPARDTDEQPAATRNGEETTREDRPGDDVPDDDIPDWARAAGPPTPVDPVVTASPVEPAAPAGHIDDTPPADAIERDTDGTASADGPDPISKMTAGEVLELLDRADAEMDRLERQANHLADQTTTYTGDAGKATITMLGGQVTGLELEQERWAGIAHHREIATEILGAFQYADAAVAAAEADLSSMPPDSAAAAIRELTADLHQPNERQAHRGGSQQ